MSSPVAACQCSRYEGHPCENACTQEDLLCDGCRGAVAAIPGSPVSHLTLGCGVLLTVDKEPFAWHVGFPAVPRG